MTLDDGFRRPPQRDHQTGFFPLTWNTSRAVQFGDWNYFRTPGTVSEDEAREVVSRLLSPDFVKQTIDQINPAANRSISGLTIEYIQEGWRYAIFRVDAQTGDGIHPFILVLSKGTPQLNEEVRDDFTNLKDLRRRMVQANIAPFVPKAFELGEANGVTGFSVEYLVDHVEMNVKKSALLESYGVSFPEYWANTDTRRQFFNHRSSADENALDYQLRAAPEDHEVLQRILFSSPYICLHEGISAEIISKLYVIHTLTGCVPRDFAINAGDIMARLGSNDVDLRLTTIRGGWQRCGVARFAHWMADHTEEIPDFYGGGAVYPFNKRCINQGVIRGFEIFGRGR